MTDEVEILGFHLRVLHLKKVSITKTKCNRHCEKFVSSLLQPLFCQKPCLGGTTKRQQESTETKHQALSSPLLTVATAVITTIKGHPGISSHICFPICCIKHSVIRLPLSFGVPGLTASHEQDGLRQLASYPANFTLSLTRPKGLTLCVGVTSLT